MPWFKKPERKLQKADRRGVPDRVRQVIAREAADCPLCGTRSFLRVGEVGIPVPR